MKLYAVCVKAGLILNGNPLPARKVPVSKIAHIPIMRRHEFEYAPAVFISKRKAETYRDKLQELYPRNPYEVVDFDSGFIELEV